MSGPVRGCITSAPRFIGPRTSERACIGAGPSHGERAPSGLTAVSLRDEETRTRTQGRGCTTANRGRRRREGGRPQAGREASGETRPPTPGLGLWPPAWERTAFCRSAPSPLAVASVTRFALIAPRARGGGVSRRPQPEAAQVGALPVGDAAGLKGWAGPVCASGWRPVCASGWSLGRCPGTSGLLLKAHLPGDLAPTRDGGSPGQEILTRWPQEAAWPQGGCRRGPIPSPGSSGSSGIGASRLPLLRPSSKN